MKQWGGGFSELEHPPHGVISLLAAPFSSREGSGLWSFCLSTPIVMNKSAHAGLPVRDTLWVLLASPPWKSWPVATALPRDPSRSPCFSLWL